MTHSEWFIQQWHIVERLTNRLDLQADTVEFEEASVTEESPADEAESVKESLTRMKTLMSKLLTIALKLNERPAEDAIPAAI